MTALVSRPTTGSRPTAERRGLSRPRLPADADRRSQEAHLDPVFPESLDLLSGAHLEEGDGHRWKPPPVDAQGPGPRLLQDGQADHAQRKLADLAPRGALDLVRRSFDGAQVSEQAEFH